MKVAIKAVKPMKRVDDLNSSHMGGLDVYHCRSEERSILLDRYDQVIL